MIEGLVMPCSATPKWHILRWVRHWWRWRAPAWLSPWVRRRGQLLERQAIARIGPHVLTRRFVRATRAAGLTIHDVNAAFGRRRARKPALRLVQ